MTDRDALLAAALAAPGDDTVRLVLADCLRDSPDPADQARGRFLWAGVVASRYRGAAVIEEEEYYDALRELTAVATAGHPARWLTALCRPERRLGAPHWGWDSTADRVTVRAGRVVGEFERGMLTELRVALADWDTFPRAVAEWPLARAAVVDVPGLMFRVAPPDDPGREWHLTARLGVPAGGPGGPRRPRVEWERACGYRTRAALTADAWAGSVRLATELRELAGERWPGPRRG